MKRLLLLASAACALMASSALAQAYDPTANKAVTLVTPAGVPFSATNPLRVNPADSSGNSQSTMLGSTDGNTPVARGLVSSGYGYLFNGTSWDRQFTCTNTAVVNVTAGNTTQIVGLSGTTAIRVCSLAVSMSAAGTVTWSYGTGSNCATGNTALTGAMSLGTATPWTQSAPEGGSLFRGTSGAALCLASATGNAVGFITYTQF